jgi:8-oxo-dGTP pyrophosphatase MutT (NUDIX family)
MPVEKSAGAVVFRRENNKIYYLLLHYPSVSHRAEKDYWDFPKGHLEKGEKEIETVKREIFEETGLKEIKFVEGFKEWIKYFFKYQGKNIFKIVTFYLVQTNKKEIKISSEHLGYEWLPFDEAMERLTFNNAREILKKADNFLKKKIFIEKQF